MRRTNTQSLGEIIKECIKELHIGNKLDEMNVVKEFKAIMPASFQKAISHVSYTNGVIHAKITSAVIRSELIMSKVDVIRAVNEKLNTKPVKDIVFR